MRSWKLFVPDVDGTVHLIFTFMVVVLAVNLFNLDILIGIALALGLSLKKELYDCFINKDPFELDDTVNDLVCDMYGILLALAYLNGVF